MSNSQQDPAALIPGALADRKARAFAASQLFRAFEALGVSAGTAEHAVNEALNRAAAADDDLAAEQSLKSLLHHLELGERLQASLRERAELICRQVHEHIQGPRVLDVGCGDGLVAQLLAADGFEVVVADIMDYRDADVHLPFHLLQEGAAFPFETASFDTVLLLTVLHHAQDPLQVLDECAHVSRSRIVLIESVYDVQPKEVNPEDEAVKHFSHLGEAAQHSYAIFIDWFYNRVLHDEVPVPYNFKSPTEWERTFNHFGLKQVYLEHLGLDQPLVPEYHTLHVVERT